MKTDNWSLLYYTDTINALQKKSLGMEVFLEPFKERRQGNMAIALFFLPNGSRELEWCHIGKMRLQDGLKIGTVASYLPTPDSGPAENERFDELERRLLDATLLVTGQWRDLGKKLKTISPESPGGAAHKAVEGKAECLELLFTFNII